MEKFISFTKETNLNKRIIYYLFSFSDTADLIITYELEKCDATLTCNLFRTLDELRSDGGIIIYRKDNVRMFQYKTDKVLYDGSGSVLVDIATASESLRSVMVTHHNFGLPNAGDWTCEVASSRSNNAVSEIFQAESTSTVCQGKNSRKCRTSVSLIDLSEELRVRDKVASKS